MAGTPAAPIRSMTGSAWGRDPGTDATPAVAVEVRTANGKGLVVKLRVPAELSSVERAIEERVRAHLHRGTVTVSVAVERSPAAVAHAVDAARFAAAAAQLHDLAQRAGLGAPTVADVLAVPGVVLGSGGGVADVEPPDAPPAELMHLLDDVLARVCASREAEAQATVAAMREHLDQLGGGIAAVEQRAPQVLDQYRERLIERVNEFLDGRGLKLEPDAVVRELGVFADRVDVSEELQRVRAHLERAHAMLDAGGQVGRPLEFLVQELLRETNTIGSKSPDVEIAHAVVAMKSAVDRLKEQAANLE